MNMKKIAYIPLDDRPCNLKFPKKLALSSDIEVITPPKEFLGYFTTPGLPNRLKEWIENVVDIVDAFIVSIDMLSYGGLIASRTKQTSFAAASDSMDAIALIKEKKSNMPVYAFNVIMRLSITADSEENKTHWENIFKYSQLADKVARLNNAEDKTQLNGLVKTIPQKILSEYVFVRNRNHLINKKAVEFVRNGLVDYLILSKEDCAEYGLHRREENDLKKIVSESGVSEKIKLLNGADEIGSMLVAKAILKDKPHQPKVAIRYSQDKGSKISLYEDCILSEVILDHMEVFGLKEVKTVAESDMVFFINSFSEKQNDLFFEVPQNYSKADITKIRSFCLEIKLAMQNGKKAAIADVNCSNGADMQFMGILKDMLPINDLSSYAGWNTSSNSIGCSLAQALLPANNTFLAERLIDDVLYQAMVRPSVNKELLEKGISSFDLKEKHKEIETIVEEQLGHLSKKLLFDMNIANYVLNISLPWPRTFEADCDIIF